MPEDGLGKIPVNIIETLDKDISVNIVATDFKPLLKDTLPESVHAALNNPDKTPGNVAILTEPVCNSFWGGAIYIPKESLIKIAYSMFETDCIPKTWVDILNEKIDAVVVPDVFYLKVYKNCGVNIPIFVLPIPMKLEPYLARSIHLKSPSKPFVFGDASANKNPAILVKAFAKNFAENPNVRLVMRAGEIYPETREVVNRAISDFSLTNVNLEEGHLLLNQHIDRLASFDCYVNLSRGEGFSFIPRESLALGIPVIITNHTALSTICNSGFVRGVSSEQKGPPNPIYKRLFKDDVGNQFDCNVEDAASALLDVYENYEKYLEKSIEGRKWVSQYDCKNEDLRKLYKTLIKPKNVLFGDKNEIKNDTIITNSKNLFEKYKKLIAINEEQISKGVKNEYQDSL